MLLYILLLFVLFIINNAKYLFKLYFDPRVLNYKGSSKIIITFFSKSTIVAGLADTSPPLHIGTTSSTTGGATSGLSSGAAGGTAAAAALSSSGSSSGGANTSGISNTSSDPIAAPATPGGAGDIWTTTPKTEPPSPPMARSFLNFEPHSASTPVGVAGGSSSLGGLGHHQAGLGPGVNHQFNPHHHIGDGGGISPLTAHHSAVFAASHHQQMAAADAAALAAEQQSLSAAALVNHPSSSHHQHAAAAAAAHHSHLAAVSQASHHHPHAPSMLQPPAVSRHFGFLPYGAAAYEEAAAAAMATAALVPTNPDPFHHLQVDC